MMDCFSKTSTIKRRTIKVTEFPLMATRFHRTLRATQGIIQGQARIEKAELQNLTRSLKRKVNCYMYSSVGEYCCALKLTVPKGLYAAVEIAQSGSMFGIYDTNTNYAIYSNRRPREVYVEGKWVFVSSANTLDIVQVVQVFNDYTDVQFVLRFKALRSPGLQVRHVTSKTGVVETPLYQDQTYLTIPMKDNTVSVKVSAGHAIMVSSRAFDTLPGHMTLYDGDKMLVYINGQDHTNDPQVYIFNASLLRFSFRDHRMLNGYAGFQIHFSFHNQSALPVRLPGNLWNCSVSHKTNFLYHLSCNLEVDCQGAEDELDCFYVTEFCGAGYLTLGGSCFFYVRRRHAAITWSEAAQVCSIRGGRLAVLSGVDKWSDLNKVLAFTTYGSVRIPVGVRKSPSSLPLWYTRTFQWTDGTTAFYLESRDAIKETCQEKCGFCVFGGQPLPHTLIELLHDCAESVRSSILCETTSAVSTSAKKAIHINSTVRWPGEYTECPMGHYTHTFLACDVSSSCWSHDISYCETFQTFVCTNEIKSVPYTLVCDLFDDCGDSSDENFCSLPSCRAGQFSCDNKQCILEERLCDGWEDCKNGDDEIQCSRNEMISVSTSPPPAIVSISDAGRLVVGPTEQGTGCPRSHFKCLDDDYCLPVALRCNGVFDCPGREDETNCDACPGFYRCRNSQVCLYIEDVCDLHAHCPQNDDELLCNSTCPSDCLCRGLAFTCSSINSTMSGYPLLRSLDASGSSMTLGHLPENLLLIYLALNNCSLKSLHDLFLPNLLILHADDNQLSSLSQVNTVGLPQLRELSLAGNPLRLAFESSEERSTFQYLLKMDLSRVLLHDLNITAFPLFPSLQVLNLSQSQVQRVLGDEFHGMKQLRAIDFRGCPMTQFPRRLFHGLSHLKTVHASMYKICCPAVLPLDFKLHSCFAPSNEISSCDDLLRGNEYKVCVFILSFLALVGNAVSFIFRTCISKRENKLGYGSFVTHLSVSDFLMGVYLVIIGVADQVYYGTYLWNDVHWKHSFPCKAAGFLSLLSSEVSALVMSLITLDRFLVITFPFSRLHFDSRSAHKSSAVVWMLGAILALIPLLPVTSHWEFYSQTGICIPLPITRTDFAGHDYSFSIIVVFNCVVFVFISLGQLSIYWSAARAGSVFASNTTRKSKDLAIARRLIAVAMTDFLCWFPVGVLGLLAANGVPIPGEANVAVAILVLPLNSAVNPWIYTFNVIMERRRRANEERMKAFLIAQLKISS